MVRVVTDSTADIPKELIDKYGIELVPLTVRLGNKMFRDYYDMSPPQFFQMLKVYADQFIIFYFWFLVSGFSFLVAVHIHPATWTLQPATLRLLLYMTSTFLLALILPPPSPGPEIIPL